MKPSLLLTLSLLSFTSVSIAAENTITGAGHAIGYAGHIAEENLEDGVLAIQDGVHAVVVPSKEVARTVADHVLKVGNGWGSRLTSDGVKINARVYASEYRGDKLSNEELKKLTKAQQERAYKLKQAQKKAKNLEDIASDYEKDGEEFAANMEQAIEASIKSASKMKGWDAEKQAKLEKLLEEHKKLGQKTSKDGKARISSHSLLSMKELWVDLETAVKKSPQAAKKAGLDARVATMGKLLKGSSKRFEKAEEEFATIMGEINELESFDESEATQEINEKQRQMALGALNNSVNTLVSDLRYSKNRSNLAFSHFDQIEKAINSKGVIGLEKGDIKNEYKSKATEIANQYNNTPIGVYVNSQISKAMGSVCELVNNQCSDGSNAKFFDFLDDSSRVKLKLENVSSPAAPASNSER